MHLSNPRREGTVNTDVLREILTGPANHERTGLAEENLRE